MNLLLEMTDSARRMQGMLLDHMGLGPVEAEYDTILERPGVKLRHYRPTSLREPQHQSQLPALVIVSAPIKAPYVWDLAPEVSVVRQALEREFEVFLVEWTTPHVSSELALEDYVGGLLAECTEVIMEQKLGSRLCFAGHSLGGTFATIYAAFRPEQVAELILVEAPLHFAEASGAFEKLLHLPMASPQLSPFQLGANRVPGCLLSTTAAGAAPGSFQLERQWDMLRSADSARAWHNHWRAVRWTLDELPMAGRLFADTVEQLYRGDRFMRGELSILNQVLGPQDVRAPMTVVYNPASRIVPPASQLDFCAACNTDHLELITYLGESGVALQHLGALIGRQAHATVWPGIFQRLQQH